MLGQAGQRAVPPSLLARLSLPIPFWDFAPLPPLPEEIINPRRTVPRAIMLVASIGGGIVVAVFYVTQLVHPGGVFEEAAA